jgi:hypothetical protein
MDEEADYTNCVKRAAYSTFEILVVGKHSG